MASYQELQGDAPQPEEGRSYLSNEAWSLQEGELNPSEVRAFGHFLYGNVLDFAKEGLKEFEEDVRVYSEDIVDPKFLPAETYIESFSQRFGLNVEVAKRWAHRASIEEATENLLKIRKVYEQTRHVHYSMAMPFEGMIKCLERVAEEGIEAAYADHLIARDASRIWDTWRSNHLSALDLHITHRTIVLWS